MKIIKPATGWFEIVEMPTYDFDEETAGNDEYKKKHLPGLASCLIIHGYVNTRVHSKLCLTTDLSLNETSLLC